MTHGSLTLQAGTYHLETQPHVRMVVKRLLVGCKVEKNTITIARTAESTENLLWILDRWPHAVSTGLHQAMAARVTANKASRQEAHDIVNGHVPAPTPARWTKDPAFALRDYQKTAVALATLKGGLLVGDDVGLGKTATGIGIIAATGGRALVVCAGSLQNQWARQVHTFCPSLRTHIIKQRKEYDLPDHDVTICTYSKLPDWCDRRQWQTVVYDEVQELRHAETGKGERTKKYAAAAELASATECRIGLSATPVYNNAGEIFNVIEALSPGTLGTLHEFSSEWGATVGNKWRVNDPEALGDWLRSQNVYIRRKRAEVGRELPPIHKINHIVEHDPAIIDRLRAQANQLAEKVLNAGFHDAGQSARQLDIMLRQTTGIAKAPFVADFVSGLVANGEQVLLAGWHREVYEIWLREFALAGVRAALFTGSESATQKDYNARAFIDGRIQVLIISLRAGAGLDGLQSASRTVVIGELDWSPQVIHQLIGRLHRDGQESQVTAFTMMADAGADPIMANVLTGKWEQSTGLTDPELLTKEPTAVPTNRVAELARDWLKQQSTKAHHE